jgi:hypothetical protein
VLLLDILSATKNADFIQEIGVFCVMGRVIGKIQVTLNGYEGLNLKPKEFLSHLQSLIIKIHPTEQLNT